MPSLTFRFTTECEMTLRGASYEEIYLRFKDFQHGDMDVAREAKLDICPPESDQMFFQVDENDALHEIDNFKGSFQQDIARRCDESELQMPALNPKGNVTLADAVRNYIPDVYW